MPRLIRRDFSFLGQIPPVGNSAKIRARGRGGLQLRGERIRPPPPLEAVGRGTRGCRGARGCRGTRGRRARGRRGRGAAGARGAGRGTRGRRGRGAADENALLLMRVGPLARPRRIKNNAETTAFVILLFGPERVMYVSRAGKRAAAGEDPAGTKRERSTPRENTDFWH